MLLPLLLNLQMASPQRTVWGDHQFHRRREQDEQEEREIVSIIQEIAPTILKDNQ